MIIPCTLGTHVYRVKFACIHKWEARALGLNFFVGLWGLSLSWDCFGIRLYLLARLFKEFPIHGQRAAETCRLLLHLLKLSLQLSTHKFLPLLRPKTPILIPVCPLLSFIISGRGGSANHITTSERRKVYLLILGYRNCFRHFNFFDNLVIPRDVTYHSLIIWSLIKRDWFNQLWLILRFPLNRCVKYLVF